MQIEIVKEYKLLKAGSILKVDRAYGLALIKKGVAKDTKEVKEEKADKKK